MVVNLSQCFSPCTFPVFSSLLQNNCRYKRFMAHSANLNANAGKKCLIRIDVSSDTVCPWCFVGKKNLEKAIEFTKDQYDFEVRWHPFFLNPDAPKEGIEKRKFYEDKFGSRSQQIVNRMYEIFKGIGLEYNMSGLTGNTLDSHRLISFAGNQGLEKQNKLVDELFLGYFTQGKYIGDRNFLVDAANKAGVEGAAEFLADPNSGLQQVQDELRKYSSDISGVPYFVINEKVRISGGQPPENFIRAFHVAAS
uniref:DSBA-like thioredoxin domain-containing protein n=2 Tax=Kalanchoe fedtschenkoi TaxID=63787 RepID=A0A7N0T8H1_KALFE